MANRKFTSNNACNPEFEDKAHRYSQLEREGAICLYRHTTRASGKISHEVAVITVAPAHMNAAGFAIDDTEIYPAEDGLGTILWRYDALSDASHLFRRLVTRAAQPADTPPAPVQPDRVLIVLGGHHPDGDQGANA